MFRKSEGFILFYTLFFIQVSALWSAYLLEDIYFNIKSLQTIRQKNVESLNINQIVSNIKKNLGYAPCVIMPMTLSKLKTLPFSWWKNASCSDSLGAVHYYYVIERLNLESKRDRVTVLVEDDGQKTMIQMVAVATA